MITFTMPDFPDPVVPPIRTFLRRIRALTGRPSSRAELMAAVIEVSGWPGHSDPLGVRISFDNPQDYPATLGRGRDRADASRPDSQPGLDRRYPVYCLHRGGAFPENDAGGAS